MPRRSLPWPSYLSSREPAHRHRLQVRIAFADCDAMGVCWHGNVMHYCERAREALGDGLGYGTRAIAAAGHFAPIAAQAVLHHRPLPYEALVEVEAALYPTRQPRLYHRYRLYVEDALAVEADSEQVLTDRNFGLVLSQPAELARILQPDR